jgi:prepilin-type N-terminal cleavage/methylation domain-containing protein
MINNKKIGFTLIELLVVITIIWILATSAVGIYTTQIKKARDSTRTTDIKAIEQAVMQFYQDKNVYPNTYSDWIAEDSTSVKNYVQVLPWDSKSGETCLGTGTTTTICDYIYNVWADKNGISNWAYKLSIWFEDEWNRGKSATNTNDMWNDDIRYEIWSWKSDLPINISSSANKKGKITDNNDETDVGEGIFIIKWGIAKKS